MKGFLLPLALVLAVGCAPPLSQQEPNREHTKTTTEYNPDEPAEEPGAEPSLEPPLEPPPSGEPGIPDEPTNTEDASISPEPHEADSPKADAGEPIREEDRQKVIPSKWDPPCIKQNPPKVELCNGIDDDCNGLVDERCKRPRCVHVDSIPEKITQHHHTNIDRIRFDPKGRTIYTTAVLSTWGTSDERHAGTGEIKVWDRKTGTLVRTLDSPIIPWDIVPSPDGKRLHTTNFHHNVLTWDPTAGSIVDSKFAGKDGVQEISVGVKLSLSRDGSRLAKFDVAYDYMDMYSLDSYVAHWDLKKNSHTLILRGSVQQYQLVPTSDMYGWVHLTVDGTVAYSYLRMGSSPYSCYSTDFQALQLSTKKQLPLPKIPTSKYRKSKSREHMFPSNDGKHLIVLYTDTAIEPVYYDRITITEVFIYELGTHKIIRSWRAHDGEVNRYAQTPDGKFLLTVKGSEVRIWDVNTGKQTGQLDLTPIRIGYTHNHSNNPNGDIDISPDGKQVAVASGGSFSLWEVSTRKKLYTVKKGTLPPAKVRAIALSASGDILALLSPTNASGKSELSIWTTNPKKRLRGFDASGALSFQLKRDGKMIALRKANTIELWDATQGKKLYTWLLKDVKRGYFHPNGKEFSAISKTQKGIFVWSLHTGKMVGVIQPTQQYEEIDATHTVGTQSADGPLFRLGAFDLATGKELGSDGWMGSAYHRISPFGRFLMFHVLHWSGGGCARWISIRTIQFDKLWTKGAWCHGIDSNARPTYFPSMRQFGAYGKRVFLEAANVTELSTLSRYTKVHAYLPGNGQPLAANYTGSLLATGSQNATVKLFRCTPPAP